MELFLETWQRWFPNLDPRMTISASLYHSAEEGIGIFGRGFFYGTEDEAKKLLQLVLILTFRLALCRTMKNHILVAM
jgi:hypothetical protein